MPISNIIEGWQLQKYHLPVYLTWLKAGGVGLNLAVLAGDATFVKSLSKEDVEYLFS